MGNCIVGCCCGDLYFEYSFVIDCFGKDGGVFFFVYWNVFVGDWCFIDGVGVIDDDFVCSNVIFWFDNND